MSYGKRAARRDANEPEIVAALRAVGATVCIVATGDGQPDLLVGFRGETYMLEVKLPLGPRGGKRGGGSTRPGEGGDGTLTRDQRAWWEAWTGSPPVIVRTPAEALEAIGFATQVTRERAEAIVRAEVDSVAGSRDTKPSAGSFDDFPKLLRLRCRCGFEYHGMTGTGRHRPPPHSASDEDRARGVLCPRGASVPAAPAKPNPTTPGDVTP